MPPTTQLSDERDQGQPEGPASNVRMGQRIAYGILAISLLVLVSMLDVLIAQHFEDVEGRLADLLSRGSVLPLVVLLLTQLGTVELMRLLRATGARPYARLAHLVVALLILSPWLSAAGWLGTAPDIIEGLYWQIVCLMVGGMGVAVLAIVRNNPEGTLRDVGATFIPIVYLGFLGSFALQLRCGRDVPGQEGAWLLLIVLLVTKSSDIGAYFAGSLVGRHKLVPKISPGKTVEGMLGGLAASALVAMLFASTSSWVDALGLDAVAGGLGEITRAFSLNNDRNGMSPILRAFFFGIAMSFAGQIGDLFESSLKRDAGAKDSGKVIPGYGGILDLIDSPLLALPAAWVLLTAVFRVV